jgi:hypothetical protein
MLLSKENYEIRNNIMEFEQKIEDMHQDFYRYYYGVEKKMPNWEAFERELLVYSRRKILDFELSKNFDRILYKFQNRKQIWLKWVEELHHASEVKEQKSEKI